MGLCECGCGTSLPEGARRPQRFVAGHNTRGHRKPRVEAQCKQCMAVFSGTAKAMANRTFCSAPCRDDFRRANLGAENPHYTQIEVACGICGTLFHTQPARLKGRNVYCSTPCAKEGRRRNIVGRAVATRHGGKRRAKIRDGFACRICGFDLFVHAHHIVHKTNGGTNSLGNLISLCPNHHAMTHANLLTAEEMLAALAQPLPHAQELRLRAKHAIHYRPIRKASVLA